MGAPEGGDGTGSKKLDRVYEICNWFPNIREMHRASEVGVEGDERREEDDNR